MNNIYKINDSKFKGICISYNLTVPIKKETITEDAVLASVLSKGSKNYNSQKSIDMFLSKVYGAKYDVNVEKIGDLYNIEFRIQFVNKKFLPGNEDVADKCIDFLYDIIYNPNIINGGFNEEVVEREKEYISEKINERKDDKLKYAVIATEELICKEEPFGIYVYGELEKLAEITNKTLYNRYNTLIKEALVTAVVSGNLEGYVDIENDIKNKFNIYLNESANLDDFNVNLKSRTLKNQIEYHNEALDTAQSVITIGLNIANVNQEDVFALLVYNCILGETPSSKLFQNVREKASLAYAVKSRYYRYKELIIIYAGVEKENCDKAKEVILTQLDDMKKGNITDTEFNAARESLISDLLEWRDSKIVLTKFILTNLLYYKNNSMNVEKMLEKIKAVSMQDVIAVANKINVELVYMLGGQSHE